MADVKARLEQMLKDDHASGGAPVAPRRPTARSRQPPRDVGPTIHHAVDHTVAACRVRHDAPMLLCPQARAKHPVFWKGHFIPKSFGARERVAYLLDQFSMYVGSFKIQIVPKSAFLL